MTSAINYIAINENFPVAGQDNDTQVFRDNFDTIKTNFREAKTEITDLQDNSVRKDVDNELSYNLISSVTLQDAYLRKKDYGSPITAPSQNVSFAEAMYHIISYSGDCSLVFQDFPTDVVDADGLGKVGKLTLELYGDGTTRKITFSVSGTTVLKTNGFPTLTISGTHHLELTSTDNPVIVEVWQHSTDIIFVKYIGSFS